MQGLTIRTQCKNNTTIIENDFIDLYMPKANGEFVKVYLYLVRHLNANDSNLTLEHMALSLDNTERDIKRALTYWEEEGLLVISYNEASQICSIDIATINPHNVGIVPNTQLPSQKRKTFKAETATDKPLHNISKNRNKSSDKSRKEFKQLLFMIEQYLSKPLSKSDVDIITYFYDTLHFPIALIEFLVEYCVENGHTSMHYIQSVALAWSDSQITTVDAAKAQISTYNKDYYTVLNAYGISGRNPAASEKCFIDKWIKEYGFSIELIQEACNRTIANIHQPSFEYTDSILGSWKTQKIIYLADLEKLDQEYANRKKAKPEKATTKQASKKVTQRTYDMDALEKQLLNIN